MIENCNSEDQLYDRLKTIRKDKGLSKFCTIRMSFAFE
jgi:hypothetical protein